MAITTPQRTSAASRFAARDRLARLGGALLDWRPLLLAVLTFGGLLAVFQLPLAYSFQIGIDRGVGTDRPFLAGFRDAELTTWDNSWRWSQPRAAITMPGVGGRPLLVSFEVLSHRQHWQPDAPQPILTVATGVGAPTAIPLRRQGGHYHLYVPAAALRDGALRLDLATEAWRNPNDSRGELGVALGRQFTLVSAPGVGIAWPGSEVLLAYPAAMTLLYFSSRVMGFGRRRALQLLLPLLVVLLGLAALTPPRVAFSAGWALEAALLALGTAVCCGVALPPLLARWGIDPGPTLRPWLLLLVALTFVLKYGGQFHPVAMPGDVQLHINRFGATMFGQVYIPAQHRGLPFPFPSGWYILVAPLLLTGVELRIIFEITAGLAEAASVLIYYVLLARLTGSRKGGLLGALIYAISPIPMMNVWWSFQTQVGSQLLTLALLAVMILGWPHYGATREARWLTLGWAATLLIMVSLGHIGAFINTGLVGLAAIPWLWLRARTPDERAGTLRLLWVGLAAAAFVAIFYYSGFLGMITEQVSGVAQDGLLGVTGKAPLERSVWLRVLWDEGFIELNGFFLVLLGVVGALLITFSSRYRSSNLIPLLWLTFAVGLSQAILPFITLSTITTRWLTFAGWGLTVGATVTVLRLRQRGWAGRGVSWLALAYVAWLTLEVWVQAMAINRPPLEPF